jgi:vacuolar iron transporter family protein
MKPYREDAVYSFILFTVGAVIPVIPFMFSFGLTAIVISVIGSVAGLFLIGSAMTIFTGKSIWSSGFRQVKFGLTGGAGSVIYKQKRKLSNLIVSLSGCADRN